MTEKISAGYFDSNRGEPIYVGDVYKEEGAMIPFHKVIKDPEKGFMVEHVGTTEKFLLKDDAKNLVKKTYLGNVFDTPDWDELTRTKKTDEPEDDLPENTPEDVKEFLNGETDTLPEGTEVISQEEAEELEKQAKEIEKANEDNSSEVVSKTENTTTDSVELVNNGTVVIDMSSEEVEPEADAVVSAEATTGPTNSPESETTDQTEEKTEEKQEEAKTPATPEVIANTKEEKNLLEKRNDYQKHIDALKRKNDELETEAVRYENLASTLTFEPFVELKMLTSNAVQDYAKKQDIKECEKHLKNYKTIDSIEALLKEYDDMAEKNRANIELNNKDIDNYEIKITEINDKLKNFQTKLDLDSVTKNEPDSEKKTENPEAEQSTETPADTEAKTEEKVEESTTPEVKDSKEETSAQPEGEVTSEDEIPF